MRNRSTAVPERLLAKNPNLADIDCHVLQSLRHVFPGTVHDFFGRRRRLSRDLMVRTVALSVGLVFDAPFGDRRVQRILFRCYN